MPNFTAWKALLFNNRCQAFAKTCQHIAFLHAKRQRCCGSQLASKVVVRNGGIKFYTLKTCCYKGIIDSMESLLKRPGLEEQCEEWRDRAIREDLYADVYDGKSLETGKEISLFLSRGGLMDL